MERIEKVLQEIENKIYIDTEHLADAVDMPVKDVQKILDELESEYRIVKVKSGKYTLASTMGVFRGKLDCKKGGFAFLRTEEGMEDIFVSASHKGGAFDEEEVIVKLLKHQEGGNHLEGKVTMVLSPLPIEIVGTAQVKNGTVFVVNDAPGTDDIFIPKKKGKGVKNEQKVVANITKRAYGGRSPEGEITEILGKAGDAGIDILAYARRFGLIAEFPDDCMKEAQALTREKMDLQDRLDLRQEMVFTIDGDDAKDLDDAVSLKKLESGNYELGVHIADVSHYVREHASLDQEALQRGTSVYLVDRVVPMFPTELSNGLCSLNPNEDKLTLSCIMEINAKGDVVSQRIENTVIRSSHRLTYNLVNRLFDGEKQYEEIADILFEMNQLAKILRARRFEKGSIDFNIDEAQIMLNKKGKPVDVVIRQRGDAEKLIEEFMLRANITVAEQYYYMQIPFLYRIHEQPDTDRMKELSIFLGNFGIQLKGFQNIHPHAIQEMLEKVDRKSVV